MMIYWEDQDANAKLVRVLNDDGIVLAQSDTVLGLFAQLSEIAKKKLDSIKVRNLKPYIVMVKSVDLLDRFIDQTLDDRMLGIINTSWPGPLTIIFKAKKELPDWLINPFDLTIAIRVPSHAGLQRLLEGTDALFTTSANISGQPLPATLDTCDPEVIRQVDVVCQNKNIALADLASTIIDFSQGTVTIIRVGAVKIDSM